MKYDLVIRNGEIVDGSGGASYIGDVAIKDGKIAALAPETQGSAWEANEVIDARGHVISPGFIDPHAHNDGYIFHDPSNIYKLSQGITTEISGNCGEGMCPVSDEFYDEIYEYYRPYYPLDDFRTYKTGRIFYDKIDKLPLGTNVGFLCAHGTLRMSVMGFSDAAPDAKQMQHMKDMLAENMQAGALGMSTGLVYSPGCFADKDEIVELCRVVKEYDGVYTTHMRSEGYRLLEAVAETIDVARRTGVRTVISHHKVLGKNFWGLAEKSTKMIEAARAEGLEIYCDQYPYTQSCSVLQWVIPYEYTEGGFVRMCEKLADPEHRRRIKDMYANKFGAWDNLMENITPSGIHILKAEATPEAVGMTLKEYADSLGEDPYDKLFDLIVENKADAHAAYDCMCEEDIRTIMSRDYCMAGTDGIDVFPDEKTHPRLTGAFPRILGRYVRDLGVLSCEKQIHKMTQLPAQVMKLEGKGLLAPGYDADICIFDRDSICDTGDFDDFNRRPEGIDYVIVAGKLAYHDRKYQNTASGRRIAGAAEKVE